MQPSAGYAQEVVNLIGEAGGQADVALGDASVTADMERAITLACSGSGDLTSL